ncbi:MAG: translation initiation factor IF-3 [Alphaproteobacteria bacterium]|nr:translation initiation factor IF-3 [Alphaproteobacteria bacterium]
MSIIRQPFTPQGRGATAEGPRKKTGGPRINREITSKQIRVIDHDGTMRGVMTPQDAVALAEESGFDLVEISPNVDPPVCKIVDYGKYKYEMQKKAAEARKKQKVIDIKEIKLRPTIDDHDFNIKMRNAQAFLKEGDKVKITMRFRGREAAHQDIAHGVLRRVRELLDPLGKVEQEPKFEGRQITMVIAAR